MLQCLFYLTIALHVSGIIITHLQEHKTTVTTESGICHTVTVVCRYRGRVGTGLSVLWTPPTANCNQFQLFRDSGKQQLQCDKYQML
jgi:hypothetical protein